MQNKTLNLRHKKGVIKMISMATLSLASSIALAQLAPQKIRVLNFNIKGTPGIAGGSDKAKLKAIQAEIIKQVNEGRAPDVIMFQEVFTKEAKKYIRDLNEMGHYPYMVLGPGADGSFSYSSGLTTLSRIPVIYSEAISYGGKNCASWDCYANKGAHVAVLKADNWPEPIALVNSHLQAGSDNESDNVRMAQMQILKNFIANQESKGFNMIIGGDLNTKPSRPSYNIFKGLFPSFINVGEFCLKSNLGCEVHRSTPRTDVLELTKDHQFFQCSQKASIIPISFVRNFSAEVDNLVLSDHKGYQVDYKIEWTSNKGCHL